MTIVKLTLYDRHGKNELYRGTNRDDDAQTPVVICITLPDLHSEHDADDNYQDNNFGEGLQTVGNISQSTTIKLSA